MFQLSIVTPSGKAFEDAVNSLAAPGLMGGFEVYSGHMPILCALKAGVVRIRKEGKEQSLTIDSGVLEVNASHNVLLLADQIMEGASH
ncbi:MAG: ATP synthase F1 subunit epsilon [Candidatus Omnitrophica bacterium]|nr:ATP synthase F1 subunit epsilon [Candidatus Omnitrophota bacterium]